MTYQREETITKPIRKFSEKIRKEKGALLSLCGDGERGEELSGK